MSDKVNERNCSNFTDQLPHVVTADDMNLAWKGRYAAIAFGCYLCGHAFEEGDTFRWQHMHDTSNFFVCVKNQDGTPSCDGPDVVERFRDLWHRTRFMRA